MSFTITTSYHTNPATGAGKVVAKGHGRQRTLPYDHDKGQDGSHGAVVGTLLNALTTPEQQAKVKHPSGGQRVRTEFVRRPSDGRTVIRWTIDV